jgi:hypothetical protein
MDSLGLGNEVSLTSCISYNLGWANNLHFITQLSQGLDVTPRENYPVFQGRMDNLEEYQSVHFCASPQIV